MLKYEKLGDDGSLVTYAYCPNSSGAQGTVAYNRASGKAVVLKYSPDEDGMCVGQMMACLRRMAAAGDFKQSGTIFWY